MNDTELIAKQVREIAELREELEFYKKGANSVAGAIYSIGGPLNDNVLEYNEKQLKIFFRILEYLGKE